MKNQLRKMCSDLILDDSERWVQKFQSENGLIHDFKKVYLIRNMTYISIQKL